MLHLQPSEHPPLLRISETNCSSKFKFSKSSQVFYLWPGTILLVPIFSLPSVPKVTSNYQRPACSSSIVINFQMWINLDYKWYETFALPCSAASTSLRDLLRASDFLDTNQQLKTKASDDRNNTLSLTFNNSNKFFKQNSSLNRK